MKKLLAFVMVIGFLLSMVSCNSFGTNTKSNETSSQKGYDDNNSESGTEKGSDGTQTNDAVWEIGEFVDEFKRPTGEKYVFADAYGTFSNSATTDSDLYACVQVTADEIAIMLWEYGSSLVKGTYETEDYSITVLDAKGSKHYFSGTMYENSTRIYVSASDKADLLRLLKQSGTIQFYLEYDRYILSSYLFSVDTTGFSTLYSKID